MSVLITPTNAVTPDELRIRHMVIRSANGTTDVDGIFGGPILPAGTISVHTVLAEFAEGAYVRALDGVTIIDVAAWIGALAAAGDPLTAEAGMRFNRANDDLKWLSALRASQLGIAARPAAGG